MRGEALRGEGQHAGRMARPGVRGGRGQTMGGTSPPPFAPRDLLRSLRQHFLDTRATAPNLPVLFPSCDTSPGGAHCYGLAEARDGAGRHLQRKVQPGKKKWEGSILDGKA